MAAIDPVLIQIITLATEAKAKADHLSSTLNQRLTTLEKDFGASIREMRQDINQQSMILGKMQGVIETLAKDQGHDISINVGDKTHQDVHGGVGQIGNNEAEVKT